MVDLSFCMFIAFIYDFQPVSKEEVQDADPGKRGSNLVASLVKPPDPEKLRVHLSLIKYCYKIIEKS